MDVQNTLSGSSRFLRSQTTELRCAVKCFPTCIGASSAVKFTYAVPSPYRASAPRSRRGPLAVKVVLAGLSPMGAA